MKIPNNAIIPDAKITKYLLVPRQQDDKSKYLSLAGFSLTNPEQLKRLFRHYGVNCIKSYFFCFLLSRAQALRPYRILNSAILTPML